MPLCTFMGQQRNRAAGLPAEAPMIPGDMDGFELREVAHESITVNGRVALFTRFMGVGDGRYRGWAAAVDAATFEPLWFDNRCITEAVVARGLLVTMSKNDVLVFDGDRNLLSTWWSYDWMVNGWGAVDGRFYILTRPQPPETPRHVWLDPVTGEIAERVVLAEGTEPLLGDARTSASTNASFEIQDVAVLVADGRAVATSNATVLWDRTADEWYRIESYLYEVERDGEGNAILRRLAPQTGEVLAELSGSTLRQEGCFVGSGCLAAREATAPSPAPELQQ
jgi:hypothetical protein